MPELHSQKIRKLSLRFRSKNLRLRCFEARIIKYFQAGMSEDPPFIVHRHLLPACHYIAV